MSSSGSVRSRPAATQRAAERGRQAPGPPRIVPDEDRCAFVASALNPGPRRMGDFSHLKRCYD